MTAFDLVALTVPDRYPELPRTPARVVGEQIRHGTPLVRLSWPNNQAAADVVPVARAA
jgi:hypothetical protein